MKFIRTLSATACLLAAAPAFAANTVIDFEGATSYAPVADYYANLGVSFTGAALALSNDGTADYPTGLFFSHAPTPGTVMFAQDSSALLNFAAGFVDELSFYYSASSSALDVVTIYSGLDGTGATLGSIGLSANAQLGGCSDSPLCNWQRVALSFAGTGKSISFGGNFGNVAFDNIAITPVPEPETYAMLAMGLAGVMLAVRRQRNRA